MAGNRCHISTETKHLFVTMSAKLKALDIERLTGHKKRTINRVLKLHRETGCVVKEPLQCGRPRILNSLDIAVSHSYAFVHCKVLIGNLPSVP